jgi:hypothetical protein
MGATTRPRKKMEMGFLSSIFPGKRYPDLTKEERRFYQTEWRRQRGAHVRAAALLKREETNRLRREKLQRDAELRHALRAAQAEWRRTHPRRTAEHYRRYRLKVDYGLTLEDYARMLAKQGGLCALCGGKRTGSNYKHLAVDHDHKTGRVRGLLCHNCNLVLGHLKDDVRLMRRAIAYLQIHAATAAESQKDSWSSGALFQDESVA